MSLAAKTIQAKIAGAKRIVIKLGTQVLVQGPDTGLEVQRLHSIVDQCVGLLSAGSELVIVSSGAVGLGRAELGLAGTLSLAEKQAAAAVGQAQLMQVYRKMFGAAERKVAQILLTADDFSLRHRFTKLKNTFDQLFKLGVVPIVNENDVVSTLEIEERYQGSRSFGDNDKLAALVAASVDADLLIILTNVDGLFTSNPFEDSSATLIHEIKSLDELARISADGTSSLGRGGVRTKIAAAKVAALHGVTTVITCGLREHSVKELMAGDHTRCTIVHARSSMARRKAWIALVSGFEGVIVVNECAAQALSKSNVSLLPAGIVDVLGDFQEREVVSIQDQNARELARGVTSYSSQEVRRIMGLHSSKVEELLGRRTASEVIHRDNLVTFDDYEG